MPYIQQEIRWKIDNEIDTLIYQLEKMSYDDLDGVVNYIISRIINRFYNKPSYRTISRGKAVLEDAKDEFNRRVMIPYEEKKIAENGDIYCKK